MYPLWLVYQDTGPYVLLVSFYYFCIRGYHEQDFYELALYGMMTFALVDIHVL